MEKENAIQAQESLFDEDELKSIPAIGPTLRQVAAAATVAVAVDAENKNEDKESTIWLEVARALMVENEETYNMASEHLLKINEIIKKRMEFFDNLIKPVNESLKNIRKSKTDSLETPKEAIEILEKKMLAYRRRAQEVQEKEQARLNAIALAKEEKEKTKLEEKAKIMEAAGKQDQAEALREKAEDVCINAPIIQTQPKTIKSAGGGSVGVAKDLTVDVVDPKKVVDAVSSGDLPIGCIKILPGTIKSWARNNNIRNMQKFGVKICESSHIVKRGK